MDKIVNFKAKERSYASPIHLIFLVDLGLFGLLSIKSGIFEPLLLMLGAIKIVLNYFMYYTNNKYKLGDPYIPLITSMMLSMGLVMQLRLSTEIGTKQFIWFLLGVVIFFMTTMVYRYIHKRVRSIILFYGVMLFLFLLTLTIGSRINGAKNWIVFGSFSIQPSEFIKIIFVYFMASFVENPEKLNLAVGGKNISSKWILMTLVFVLLGFFVLQREFGTALLVFMVYVSMLYVFERAVAFSTINIALAAIASSVAIQFLPHLQARVTTWLNPFKDIAGKGYQITQSLFAIGSGSFFGAGVGLGYPSFIPNVETDFIFSAICEEMGIFGGIAIIILFMLLVYRGIKTCLLIRDPYTKAVAFGLTILLGFQSFLIIGGVTRVTPLTGVTLPFFSYGGSSLVSSFLILGLLQALSGPILREEVCESEKNDDKQ